MNMFQEIKDAVSAREAASFYGLKTSRNGMCCCPFHDDRHPSTLKQYVTIGKEGCEQELKNLVLSFYDTIDSKLQFCNL